MAVEHLLGKAVSFSNPLEIDRFLIEAHLFSHELPARIRRVFYEFKLTEFSEGICIRNNPINLERVGRTPLSLPSGIPPKIIEEDVLHLLYGSLLGEIFGWSNHQGGHVINDVMPVWANRDTNNSSGSNHSLGLHTEDASHASTGDYFGLMCLRNPERVPTMISSIDDVRLDPKMKSILFEPRFIVKSNGSISAGISSKNHELTPILFGHPKSPYMRISTTGSYAVEGDHRAREALDALVTQLQQNAIELVLEPGDCCYLDNFKTAHGRQAYSPRYDGTDRWLKRIVIVNDLRKSRNLRSKPSSRVINRI
jgi:L-asparagine oxygenase